MCKNSYNKFYVNKKLNIQYTVLIQFSWSLVITIFCNENTLNNKFLSQKYIKQQNFKSNNLHLNMVYSTSIEFLYN